MAIYPFGPSIIHLTRLCPIFAFHVTLPPTSARAFAQLGRPLSFADRLVYELGYEVPSSCPLSTFIVLAFVQLLPRP